MHAHDLIADLAEHDGKQVKTLETDGLVGCNEHSAALFEIDQMIGRSDLGLRYGSTLADVAQALVVLGGRGVDGAVVHAVKAGDGRGDGGQDISLLHTGLYAARDVLGKQNRGLGGREKLLDNVAARAAYLDIEALELALERIESLIGSALVVFVGVERLEGLLKASAALGIHALFELYFVEIICHVRILLT